MGSRMLPSVTMARRLGPPTSCCCLHLTFLRTVPGTLKLAQLMIGSVCETLLVTYGPSNTVIGPAFMAFLNTVSCCVWTTLLLTICYIFSSNSYGLIRSSLLELIFSVLAAWSLLSGSAYMCYSVKVRLVVTMGLIDYPAMTAAYMLGFILTALYTLDAYHAYRHYKGYE